MKKIFTLCFFLSLFAVSVQAQLPDGSVAPDFTATDIEGNEWNLYSLLDEGKTVILDFSATWCGPCWSYHESGALEDLYETYGPDGSDEVFVFMLESDDDTELDCLYNGPDCTGGTTGDWVTGTHYPIIDNAANIAAMYEVGYYPTIYHVCQNRLISEAGQVPTAELYSLGGSCLSASGMNNAGILKYTGFEGTFCGNVTFKPSIQFQNLGTEPMTSATISLLLNGDVEETVDWSGDLGTFGIDEFEFSEITISDATDLAIAIVNVNGTTDDDMTNNGYVTDVMPSISVDQNSLVLEFFTDEYPGESYWELRDANGNAFYTGGNSLVVGGAENNTSYTQALTLYNEEIPLPGDGCYEFIMYDSYGDGICCEYGEGYYRLTDASGNVIIEGGNFETQDVNPFKIEGATPISDNGAIVLYSGNSGQFCGEMQLNPVLTMQNLGANDITEMVIEANGPSGNLISFNWTGTISSGSYGTVDMGTIGVTEGPVTVQIVSINGETDAYPYKNDYSIDISRNYTQTTDYLLEIQTDGYAYEFFWQFQNSAGDIFAFGGNEVVGIDGGGLGGSAPTDPGAYANNTLVSVPISVPEYIVDCYELFLVDSYGDGFVDGGGGYVKLTDPAGNVIYEQDLSSTPFSTAQTLIDAEPEPNAVQELVGLNNVQMFPNPVSDQLNVQFNLLENTSMQVSIFNVLGQQVSTVANQNFNQGSHRLDVNVANMNSGIYYLRFSNDGQLTTKKFTVVNN